MRRTRVASTAAAYLGIASAWTLVAAAVSGGSPWGVAGVAAASAVTLVAAAAVTPSKTWVVPAAVVSAAAMMAVASASEIASRRPHHGPFGYANATGAFFLLATIAALMLAAGSASRPIRIAGGCAAAAFAGITVASGSAAAALLLLLPAAALIARGAGSGRAAVVAAAVVFVIALLATAVAGVAPGGIGGRLVDERRTALWHEAETMIADNPLTGTGPGGFSQTGTLARSDPDARWAHSGFLQIGAETGLPGVGLVLAGFAVLFLALGRRAEPSGLVVLGAAALAAFGVGASIDYLMHFPAIPVTAAALAGTATSQIDV